MKANAKNVDATKVLNQAILKVAIYVSLSQKELSQIVGCSHSQINRLFTQDINCIHQNTKEWECALLLLRIIRSLEAILGEDPKQLREWLYSYNHHLSGIPIEMIKSLSQLNEVVNYLDAMRGQG